MRYVLYRKQLVIRKKFILLWEIDAAAKESSPFGKFLAFRGMIVHGAGRDIDELEDVGRLIWTREITVCGTRTMFSGARKSFSSTCRTAAAQLRELVVAGELPLGEQLSERKLAAAFGVAGQDRGAQDPFVGQAASH
ncbi:hypothetical protein QO002_005079 [Pararhizobium capsulatum DSM 1112]|uniref:HTH gntR-type domain-containing protein n=1 Tax=Pararhizobium capsulatum DSM 1112 TaxID=1121113 RepID=A0ABU0BX86_9HYPH|nr:hypothetical protein [Pararhizobium capsulatum DSM 1112]